MHLPVALGIFSLLTPSLAYHSCKDLKESNPGVMTGVYEMFNGLGQTYTAFCEFYDTHGYQFVSRSADVDILVDIINPSASEVLVRHVRSNGNQFDTTMQQHSAYSSIPLAIQYNQNVDYADPQNKNNWAPYLYLGFLPKSVAGQKTNQGFRANNNDQTFSNCDANPNSYLAFFFDRNNGQPSNYHLNSPFSALMRSWIDAGTESPNYLPSEFFMKFEMHMGGCGGYAINGHSTLNDIYGAALGMRFELSPPPA